MLRGNGISTLEELDAVKSDVGRSTVVVEHQPLAILLRNWCEEEDPVEFLGNDSGCRNESAGRLRGASRGVRRGSVPSVQAPRPTGRSDMRDVRVHATVIALRMFGFPADI